MSDTILRADPGALAAGTGLSFRTNLNADRAIVYGHLTALEAALELLASSYCGKGTIPGGSQNLYIDDPVSGRVYCPVGYAAVITGAPVITTAIISQAYTPSELNYVYLVVSTSGVLSLRVSTTASEAANELLIATVTAVPAIDNAPSGKVYADINLKNALKHTGTLLGVFNTTPVIKTSVADLGALGNANGEIAGLTFSATPTQAECEALRDKCEEAADDMRAIATKLNALLDALQSYGLV